MQQIYRGFFSFGKKYDKNQTFPFYIFIIFLNIVYQIF